MDENKNIFDEENNLNMKEETTLNPQNNNLINEDISTNEEENSINKTILETEKTTIDQNNESILSDELEENDVSKEDDPIQDKQITLREALLNTLQENQKNPELKERHYEWMIDEEEEEFIPPEPKQKSWKRFLVGILTIAIVGGFFTGIGMKFTDRYLFGNIIEKQIKYTPNLVVSTDISKETPIVSMIKDVSHSTVSINANIVTESFFGLQNLQARGSGIIFDISTDKIYIVTNNHVIDNAKELAVTFYHDENRYKATLLGRDKETDLAILSIKKSDLNDEVFDNIRPIKLGNSDGLQVGESVIAIGNPLGYSNTATSGIISALNRNVENNLNTLTLIQTDAAINPGNSGGALVNTKGELIGINTIKIVDTDVEGIGFAIPINSAVPIINEIIKVGHIAKPFIGISGRKVSDEENQMYNVPKGVVVTQVVRNSPAMYAGIKQYDIITNINGNNISSWDDLIGVVSKLKVNQEIEITLSRHIKNEFSELKVKLTIADKDEFN